MKKTILIIITVILLLLAVSSTAVLALGLAENGILSWDAMRGAALSSGWNESVRRQIRAGFEPINTVTDVPETLTDAFLEEAIPDELCAAFWSEGRINFPGDALKADLTKRIRTLAEQLREKGEIHVTEEEWKELVKSIPETASNYIKVVRKAVTISSWSGALKTVTDLWSRYRVLFFAVSAVLSAGSLGLLALIYKRRFLTIAYAGLTGAGLTLLVPALWLKASDFAARLQLDPDYLKTFLVRFYEDACGRMLTAALIVTLAGAVCGVVSLIAARRGKKKSQAEKGTEA